MAKAATTKKTTIAKAPAKEVEVTPVGATQDDAQPERKAWKMPKPCRGQTVIFFYRSTISEKNADIAFVTSIGESQISVAYRGTGYGDVLHRDDPRLASKADIRRDIDGVWDFTNESLEYKNAISDLTSRVEALEQKTSE